MPVRFAKRENGTSILYRRSTQHIKDGNKVFSPESTDAGRKDENCKTRTEDGRMEDGTVRRRADGGWIEDGSLEIRTEDEWMEDGIQEVRTAPLPAGRDQGTTTGSRIRMVKEASVCYNYN